MELIRAEASIKALKNKKNATIVDALNVFFDLCQDIKKHEGTLLHKLPVGDENAVVNRLVWGSNQLQKIAKHNEDTIGYEAQAARLQSLEKETKELEERLASSNSLLEACEKRKEELYQLLHEEEARLETQKKLEEECDVLEEKIKSFEENKIPELEIEKKDLTVYFNSLVKTHEKLLNEVSTMRDAIEQEKVQLDGLTATMDELVQKRKAIEEKIEALEKEKETLLKQEEVCVKTIQEYQDCIDTTNASIKKYRADIVDYEDKIKIVKKRCEDASNELQALLQRYDLLDEKRQVAESEAIQWTANVKSMEKKCEDTENEKNKQEKLFEQLKQKKATLEATIEELGEQQQILIQDIRLLEETLRKSSVDELRKEKQDKEKQLEGLKQERVELNLAIQTLTDKIIDRENEKRNLIDTVNQKKELLTKRELEITGLRGDKETWERKLQTLQRELEALQLWFKNRDNSEDKKRMDSYKNRIAFLQEAQSEWKAEAQLIQQFANQNVRGIFNQFNDDYEAYHQTLMQIDEILNNYQQAYAIVTRALYLE